ncbi:hypothetical protein [Gracilimonas tropica]|uniref:hypothetical protein n=1 Tax=Gracilimonas tropica TaxID=454600 RepID=UPI000369234C|nr:hypothetical protein [Gracilimonas tropica]
MAKRGRNTSNSQPMFFSAYNYKLIGMAIFLIFAGFTAMYMENEVKGFISLFISPVVIMAGYILVVFAIMKHDRDDQKEVSES